MKFSIHGLFLLFLLCQAPAAKSQCSVDIVPQGSTMLCEGDVVTLNASGGSDTTVVDQIHTTYNAGTSARNLPGYSYWQSFTAGMTGTMSKIEVGFFNFINGNGYLTIFNGTGTSGTQLDSLVVNVNCPSGNCLIPFAVNIPIVSGSVYTFQFRPGPSLPDPYGLQVENPGSYSGGEMGFVDPGGISYPGFDLVFKTWVKKTKPVSYLWSTGSTDSSITVNVAGTYSVVANDSSGCTSTDTIVIQAAPTSVPIITRSNDTLFSSSAVSYQWYYNGSPVSLATDSFYVITQDGTYAVRVINTYGCSVLSNGFIVTALNELLHQNDLTPIRIYPNPAEDQLTIDNGSRYSSGTPGASLKIFNMLGEMVLQSEIRDRKSEINITSLAKGIYLVEVGGEEVCRTRFVKK